jgi:hypothetical protein
MSLSINKKLNIVFPLREGKVWVHSTPIARQVFEAYFIPISKTFEVIYGQGLNIASGPRIAALMLKKVSIDSGLWGGNDGVQNGLMREIRRLSNVLLPTPMGGWDTMPLHSAIQANMLDEDEIAEVDNTLVFFTCVSVMHRRDKVALHLSGMLLYDVQTTLLNSTEYATSLQTSTTPEIFGAKMGELLVAS